ncbi:MAG: S-layer homology domain-containing protein [Evtepia sp.]
MMLSVMVVGAGAAFSDQSKIKNTEAVDACTALNIIGGYPDGSFKPEGNITRAEVTKMICVALNGGKEPNLATNATPTFSDVRTNANSAWAEKYIESCYAQGIVSGVGAGKFAPAGNVTGTQLAKMLLVALGYKSENEGFTGNAWATNVNTIASAKGLYEGLEKLDVSAALTRDSAARMIWNALQAYEVEYKTTLVTDSKGQLTSQITVQDKVVGSTNDKITLLRDKYDAWMNVGTLVKVDGKDLTIAMNSADRAASDLVKDADNNDLTSLDFTKLGKDYSALMGQKVKIIFKNGKTNDVLGVYATEDNTVYNTVMNAVEKDGAKIKFDGKSYSAESTIKVYVNGTRIAKATGNTNETDFTVADFDDATTEAASLLNGSRVVYGKDVTADVHSVANRISADEVKFIDTDDNDKIDAAIITTVDVVKATYVSSTEIVAGSKTYKFEDENISKDIKKDDYVAIRKDLYGDCLSIVPAEKLSSAKITGTKTNPNQYLIGGTWYVEGKNADMNSAKSGDTVNAYVVNGVAFYAKRASGENSTLSDVAVVLAVGSDIQGDKAKILKMDKTGSTEIVDIDNDPGAGYVAKKDLKNGAVYEYSVKSGEYRFKELSTTKDYFGDYTAMNNGAPSDISSGLAVAGSANADKSIGGTTVDDSAKIILITNYDQSTADYKVITGKQFKSLTVGAASNNALTKGGIAAFTSKVDGVTRVTYGVVAVQGIANSFVTNDNYCYVTADSYATDSGYIVYSVWTGTEEVKVQEKGSNQTTRNKGDVLGYSSITKEEGLSDGVIGTIEDVDDNFGLVDNGVVYGVNDKQTKVSLNGSDKAEVNSDTVVLYVDTDDHKGYTKGSIVEANDFNNGKIANVMYVLDNPSVYSSDVTLLIVDVKNNLHGDFNVVFNSATTAAADINAALAKGDVTVASLPDSGVVVPAGKTLTVTSAQTYAKVAAVGAEAGAKLVLEKATSDNATGDVFKDKNSTSYSGSNVKADTYTASVSSSAVTWTGTLAK